MQTRKKLTKKQILDLFIDGVGDDLGSYGLCNFVEIFCSDMFDTFQLFLDREKILYDSKGDELVFLSQHFKDVPITEKEIKRGATACFRYMVLEEFLNQQGIK